MQEEYILCITLAEILQCT